MKTRKILSLMLAVCVFLTMSLSASAIEIEEGQVSFIDIREAEIQSLYDEKATLLSEMFIAESEEEKELYNAAIEKIDEELVALGVTFHTEDEVARLFPETKNDKQLALSGETNVAEPNVSTPSSGVNSWSSYRTTYTSGGVTYNIQKLTAQPKSDSSPLRDTGGRIVEHSKSWTAGAGKVFAVVGETIVGAATQEIPGSSFYLTFYNAANAFISGMSTTTEVKAPEINYTWSGTTTAVFTYVRLNSQSDDYQWLSLISTKNKTVVGYDIPTFTYKSGSSWLMEPDVVQGKNTIESIPTGYDSNAVAIAAYTSVSGGPVHRAVSRVRISGPETNTVQNISVCYPQFPAHCE